MANDKLPELMKGKRLSQSEYNVLKRQVYVRDKWHCRSCNNSRNLTPHHIVFRSQGGEDRLDNLITLCINCHDGVHGGKLEILWERETMGGILFVRGFRRKGGWKP